MQDLEPYSCIQEQCETALQCYPSRKLLFNHLRDAHQSIFLGPIENTIKCLFCGDEADEFPRLPAEHYLVHLEDISFVVIPRAYEDWAFYSDSANSVVVEDSDHD